MKRMQMSQLPEIVRRQVEATEHNIEDLLLCMHGMRPDEILSMHWNWDEEEWQPALIDEDEHYPQCYDLKGDAPQPGEEAYDYQILWSVPICGRDQTKHWHDIQHFRTGSVRQALIFDYDVSAPIAPHKVVDKHRLTVWFGATEKVPLAKVLESDDNRITVDADLIIALTRQIDDLKACLTLESQAEQVMQLRAARHESMDVHTNE